MTAVVGGIFGFLLAYAVILGGLPRFLRPALMTFSGVASNFAGVPAGSGVHLHDRVPVAWSRSSCSTPSAWTCTRAAATSACTRKLGLEIVYLYFQFPLMVLIIAPAIDGLRRSGARRPRTSAPRRAQYWRHVALPILMPSLLGTIILLFGNAFGAQATAFQLTGGLIPCATLLIGVADQRRRPPQPRPRATPMAIGMVVDHGDRRSSCTAASSGRSERWLES